MDEEKKHPGTNNVPNPPIRRHRRSLMISVCCLSLIVVIGIIALILALTVFKRRDPTMTVTSMKIIGVSPKITFPVLSFRLNLTLVIDSLVHNPNMASFSHAPGTVGVFYRGAKVGEADVDGGNIPERGSEVIESNLTFTLDSSTQGGLLGGLLEDVGRMEIELDTESRIPGRFTVLGFIRKNIVATSDCRVVIGLPGLDVKERQCHDEKAKL